MKASRRGFLGGLFTLPFLKTKAPEEMVEVREIVRQHPYEHLVSVNGGPWERPFLPVPHFHIKRHRNHNMIDWSESGDFSTPQSVTVERVECHRKDCRA